MDSENLEKDEESTEESTTGNLDPGISRANSSLGTIIKNFSFSVSKIFHFFLFLISLL